MGTFKILHLSDLLISSSHSDHDIQSLLNYFNQGLNGQKLDYLVVCGNLTKDGTPDSFEKAKDFLERLVDTVLKRDIETKKNRIMIVPGKNDFQNNSGTRDFSSFQLFYRSFLLDNLSDNQAIVRHLKDLTFVGASYWCPENDEEFCHSLIHLYNQIEQGDSKQNSSIEYCKRTPTILVTSGTPVFHWISRLQSRNYGLTQLLTEQLGVKLHLFGSGSVFMIASEPFAFKHISLGTGPRQENEVWPLRMNIVDMPAHISDDDLELSLTLQSYQREFNQGWIMEDNIYRIQNIRPQSNYDRPYRSGETIISHFFLNRLQEVLPINTLRPFLVKGFPGCGKSVLRSYCNQKDVTRIKLNNREYVITAGSWYQYGDESRSVFEEIQRKLKQHGESETKLALLFDFAFGATTFNDLIDKEGDLQRIQSDFQALRKNTIIPIYFIDPGSDSSLLKDILGDDHTKLPILDDECFEQIANEFHSFTPFENKEIEWLTGRYAGLSFSVLSVMKDKFDNFSGAQTIKLSTSRDLLKESIKSENVESLIKDFLKCVEKFPAGPQVCSYLRSQVAPMGNILSQNNDFGIVEISKTNLIEQIHGRQLQNNAQRVFQLLIEYDVLRPQADRDTYCLNVIAPFLTTVDTYTVFISYCSQYLNHATATKQALEESLKLQGSQPRLFCFENEQSSEARVSNIINTNLKQSRNLIIIFDSKCWSSSRFVQEELSDWLDDWGQEVENNNAVIIPIAMDNSRCLDIYEAADFRCFHYTSNIEESRRIASEQIMGKLRAEDVN